MTPEQLINELNLDETPETTQLLTNLITSAKVIVSRSVNSTVSSETYEADVIYQRAVATLATQLFYDRTLSGGMSLGLKMMIETLQGEYINA